MTALSGCCDRLIWDDLQVSSTYKGYRFARGRLALRMALLLVHPFVPLVPRDRVPHGRAWNSGVVRYDPRLAGPSSSSGCGGALRPGDKWNLGEVFVKIRGVRKYLWRVVDQHGNVLDVSIQGKRNGKAGTGSSTHPSNARVTRRGHSWASGTDLRDGNPRGMHLGGSDSVDDTSNLPPRGLRWK
ncbi:DDE-type integrase/transposase/recombinase [Rhodococcus qingshengii]|uniref:DDE-type integrase/transposase/recombinase n=1 Tax=Rhodococcus qingshengii TaxID=334542 RepID=UPI0036DD4516